MGTAVRTSETTWSNHSSALKHPTVGHGFFIVKAWGRRVASGASRSQSNANTKKKKKEEEGRKEGRKEGRQGKARQGKARPGQARPGQARPGRQAGRQARRQAGRQAGRKEGRKEGEEAFSLRSFHQPTCPSLHRPRAESGASSKTKPRGPRKAKTTVSVLTGKTGGSPTPATRTPKRLEEDQRNPTARLVVRKGLGNSSVRIEYGYSLWIQTRLRRRSLQIPPFKALRV